MLRLHTWSHMETSLMDSREICFVCDDVSAANCGHDRQRDEPSVSTLLQPQPSVPWCRLPSWSQPWYACFTKLMYRVRQNKVAP